jgi:hypothetical protein
MTVRKVAGFTSDMLVPFFLGLLVVALFSCSVQKRAPLPEACLFTEEQRAGSSDLELEFQALQCRFLAGTPAERAHISELALERARHVDVYALSPDLQLWVRSLQFERSFGSAL